MQVASISLGQRSEKNTKKSEAYLSYRSPPNSERPKQSCVKTYTIFYD